MHDLTIIYITANVISPTFMANTQEQLKRAAGDTQIISVSHQPIDLGRNIVVSLDRGHLSIYKQALLGAQAVTTGYIAIAEDDVLYSAEHFKYRPKPGKFGYNMNSWSIFTWGKPMFSMKLGGRLNLNGLICDRKLFIEAMSERFSKYPDDNVNLSNWAEPGKYEYHLGVTQREVEKFVVNPSNIVFTHQDELSYANLGHRKRVGEVRAYNIPHWGSAERIMQLYV